jgi:hypothetical protein
MELKDVSDRITRAVRKLIDRATSLGRKKKDGGSTGPTTSTPTQK